MLDAENAKQLMRLAHRKVLLHDPEKERERRRFAASAAEWFAGRQHCVPDCAPIRLPASKVLDKGICKEVEADLDCAIGRAAATGLPALCFPIWFDPIPYARKRAVVKWVHCVLRHLGYASFGGFVGSWRNPQEAVIYVAWFDWKGEEVRAAAATP